MPVIYNSNSDFVSRKYLIVDDFQGMRTMLREMLKAFGAKDIDMASNGKEAIDLLDRSKYDVVLCDFNLGAGKNGQQVLEEAKYRNLVGPATAWIMISAEKTTEMVMGAAEYQPDDYLIKPINEATLQTRLDRILTRKSALSGIEKAIRAKDYSRAIALCDEKLKSSFINANDLLRTKSSLYLTMGAYEKAKQVFEQVLGEREVPWAKTGLAKVNFMMGDFEAARGLLEEVVEENKTYLEGYDWLAKTLEQLGDMEGAQRVIARTVELSPYSIPRQKELGEIAHKRGDLNTAEKAYRKAISLGTNSVLKSPATYIGLAKICTERNNPQEALSLLDEVQTGFDGHEVALHAKVVEGEVYRKSGDQAKAGQVAREVPAMLKDLSKVPTQVSVEAAQLLLQTGDKEAASQLLQAVVKNNHEDEKLINQVKEVFADANMGEDGHRLVESSRREAVEINNKGVLLAREGKLEEAIEWLRNAKSMLPNNKRVLLNLTNAMLLHMKRHGKDNAMLREARESLDRVLKLDPGEKTCAPLLEMLETLAG